MKHSINNEYLNIKVKDRGAELTNIISVDSNLEFLWQAEHAIWPRHAPVLFPIVGKLNDGKYLYKDNTYELPQHGFARDMDFTLVRKEKDSLTFVLTSTTETLLKYPFEFEFYITYKLTGNKLITTYKVVNIGKEIIFFSVGGHPAYRCPLENGEKFEDYFLEFEKNETVGRYLIQNGTLNPTSTPLLENEKMLNLSTSLFKDDAIVLKELQSRKIALKSKKSAHTITMEFDGFPFFGIWTKPGNDVFICLEPWIGIADTESLHPTVLSAKEGIMELEANGSFEASYAVSFS